MSDWLNVLLILGVTAAAFLVCQSYIPHRKTEVSFREQWKEFLNFHWLMVEHLLPLLYVAGAAVCVYIGLYTCLLLRRVWAGILVIILGPVVLRLLFEIVNLLVSLAKNAEDIRKKISGQEEEK